MQAIVKELRQELAQQGIEMTAEALHEVLQAAYHIASYLEGSVIIDAREWFVDLTIDPGEECGAWVDIGKFEEVD